jgi:superfamily I DNA/RNA helicase
VDSLLRGGVDASEILVFCATPDAAQNLHSRLGAVSPSAKEPEITTPRAFFLNLLGTKEASAITGRKARLLLPFEYDFFLEDLKTSGIRPRRLREILGFFYKGLSDLADEDKGWLITNEERELFGLMQECLVFSGAILEPELANLAVKYLRSSKEVPEVARRNYVFVDDFQLLSRASQFASCLLATKCLYLSASQDAALEVFESYPHSEGVDEFIRANPSAVLTRLSTNYSCYSAAKAYRALRQENGIDASGVEYSEAATKTCFQLIEGESPQEETARIADEVTQLLGSGLSANDIVIAAPHSAWSHLLLRQLETRDIPAEVLQDARFLKGDIRSNEKCFNARLLTVLGLVADPTDAVAWRCWCGFGDYLTNSSGMRSLRNLGKAQGKTLDSVLETIDLQLDRGEGQDAFVSTQRIVRERDEAYALLARLSGFSGQSLLDAITKELAGADARVPAGIKRLVAGREDDPENDSATAMICRARARVGFPAYRSDDVIRIASYQNVAGMNPRYVFLSGFMNGFLPKHDYFDRSALTIEQREKRSTQDLNRIADLVAKAGDTLVVSYSKTLDLEDAERLGLVINRIAFENGKRVAKTEPSIFMQCMKA